jgi:aerobic carbon-monoxide dehydrogenase large subunit
MIGSRLPRLEDHALLTGRGCYVDDIAIVDPLHAAFLRSPHPHGLIRAIRTDAARALPGVCAVLALEDIAPAMAKRRMVRTSNSGTPLERCWAFALADGEVSYVGEPVVLVLAKDRYVAEDAAALVEVDYEVLASAGDCRKAALAGAPPVRREISSNVISSYRLGYGDIDAAFRDAAHICRESF